MATNDGGPAFPHSVEDLNMSVRTTNALVANDIITVEQLCCTSSVHLMTFRNFGRTSLREVIRELGKFGLSIGCGRVVWASKTADKINADEFAGRKPVEFMTMRDHFAAAALSGMLANDKHDGGRHEYARVAYAYADAMLSAREAKP